MQITVKDIVLLAVGAALTVALPFFDIPGAPWVPLAVGAAVLFLYAIVYVPLRTRRERLEAHPSGIPSAIDVVDSENVHVNNNVIRTSGGAGVRFTRSPRSGAAGNDIELGGAHKSSPSLVGAYFGATIQ